MILSRPGQKRLQTSGFRLQASGYRLQATGYRLQATGYRLQATGYRLQATGYRLQATGRKFPKPCPRLTSEVLGLRSVPMYIGRSLKSEV
jgi:hypothetical protein